MLIPASVFLISCAESQPIPDTRADVTSPAQPADRQPIQTEPTQAEPAQTDSPTNTQPATAATTPTSSSSANWWLTTPDPIPGSIRLVASATATTLLEARQQAIDNAREQLTSALGQEPTDVAIDRTNAQQNPDGSYTWWVLVTAPQP